VKFNSGKNFIINGTVRANGTSSNKAYFTSIKDDAIGGDTNGDGSQTQPAAKNWSGFRMGAGSTVELSNTVVRYGNQGIYYYAPSGYYYDSNYFIKKLSVQNCEISNCYHGIYILGAQSALVSASTIQNNSAFGMMIVHCENPDLHDNKISSNGTTGVNSKAVEIDPKALPKFVGNKLSNNTQNGVWIWDAAQKASDMPNKFSFTGANATLFNGTTYILYGTTWVSPTTTFTVQAGTVVKGQPGALVVRGKLAANGQKTFPITFTSYRDSNFGGNTNGSISTPGTSDWGGIRFESGSSGTLTNVRIKHASTGISGTNANITIANSILEKNGTAANNTINSPEINAVNNWWGAANGPKPYGSGNKVVGKVAVKPWLTTSPF
jgi:parallel beta-helix repeat protein